MEIRADVAELLRAGLSSAEVARRTGVTAREVRAARTALHLPDHRAMKPGPVAGPSHRAHGTRVKYVIEKCRCTPCKQANRREENHRTRMQMYGRWQPYIDAEPVRAHVTALQAAGLGWKRIAALAGVPTGTISKLLYGVPQRGMGPSKRVRPETAEKILAVQATADNLGGAVTVDGTGTRRRLQALVAAGWPQARLAHRMDIHPGNIGNTLRSDRVLAATARAATALYDQLWRVDPRQHGVGNQAYSRARRYAITHHWAPVGAWDDDTINDPDASPDWTGKCGSPQGYYAHYKNQLLPACQPCKDAKKAQRREAQDKAVAA